MCYLGGHTGRLLGVVILDDVDYLVVRGISVLDPHDLCPVRVDYDLPTQLGLPHQSMEQLLVLRTQVAELLSFETIRGLQ